MRYDIRATRDARNDRIALPIRPGNRWAHGVLSGASTLVDLEDEFRVVESIRNCGRLILGGNVYDNSASVAVAEFGVGDISSPKYSSFKFAHAARPLRKRAAQIQQENWEATESTRRRQQFAEAEIAWEKAKKEPPPPPEPAVVTVAQTTVIDTSSWQEIGCLPLIHRHHGRVVAEFIRKTGFVGGAGWSSICIQNRFQRITHFEVTKPKKEAEREAIAWMQSTGLDFGSTAHLPEVPDESVGAIFWVRKEAA